MASSPSASSRSHLGRTLPLAHSLGLSIEDLGAAYATMTLQGESASQVETNMQALMTAAVKPTKAMSAALADYNVDGQTFASVTDLIQKPRLPRLSRSSWRKRRAARPTAWRSLTGNVRSTNGALALTSGGMKTVTAEEERMKHASDGLGATQEAFAKQQQSAAFALKIAPAFEMERAAITLGQQFLPVVG
jgi:hypothetical protein